MRYDLVVLVADADAEQAINTLLTRRTSALGIRSISVKLIRHDRHDAGVFREAETLLRRYLHQARYCLVMLDYEGSGYESRGDAEGMEDELEDRLALNGWDGRSAVIAFMPELEVWVWTQSPHVRTALNITQEQLDELRADEKWGWSAAGKPARPKEAMRAALGMGGRNPSAAIFRELADKVSLKASERAFDKFRTTLKGWFPP